MKEVFVIKVGSEGRTSYYVHRESGFFQDNPMLATHYADHDSALAQTQVIVENISDAKVYVLIEKMYIKK